jgi:hypothetical protein
MVYFNKFPKLRYSFDNGKTTQICVDVLRRVALRDKIKSITEMFVDYNIKEGERPDIVADKIYGDSGLHWLILISNEIHNQYYEWPMSQRQLDLYNERIYPGQTFFLNGVTGSGGSTIVPDFLSFSKNQTLVGVSGGTFTMANGVGTEVEEDGRGVLVHDWDKSLARLMVSSVTGSFVAGDFIALEKESDGSTVYDIAKIGRLVQISSEALHHFEDSAENHLSPMATPPNTASITADSVQFHLGGTNASGEEVTYDDTILDSYINGSVDTFTVTNSTYEFRRNEEKRSIKLIRPEFVTRMAQEFEELIQGNV